MKSKRIPVSTKKLLAFLVAGTILSATGYSEAMGLGSVTAQSAIGAPFQAEIELMLSSKRDMDTVLIKSASPQTYAKEGVPFTPLTASLTFKLRERGGRYFAQISSPVAPSDSVVRLILEGTTTDGALRRTFEIPMQPNMERNNVQVMQTTDVSASVAVAPRAGHKNAVTSVIKVQKPVQYVIEKGQRPRLVEHVTDGGENQPLGKALATIVPKGWRGFANDTAVKNALPVTWSAKDAQWPDALQDVLSTRGIRAKINWDKLEVEFSAIPAHLLAMNEEEEITVITEERDVVASPTSDLTPGLAAVPSSKYSQVSLPIHEVVYRDTASLPRTQATSSAQEQRSSIATVPASVSTHTMPNESAASKQPMRAIELRGRNPGDEKTVPTQGYNVAMMSAIGQIVPTGWMIVSIDGRLAESKLVAWNGRGRSWLAVFDEVLMKNNYSARVNADRREIEIFKTA